MLYVIKRGLLKTIFNIVLTIDCLLFSNVGKRPNSRPRKDIYLFIIKVNPKRYIYTHIYKKGEGVRKFLFVITKFLLNTLIYFNFTQFSKMSNTQFW